jgi:diadenosine tetraphosphatase ApaH/serine/threonine PP2A family protein phosphatase
MGRHIIIGDVHGMKPEVMSLIDSINPSDDDQIVFVGDLVDKGDDSPGVVRFVRELSQRFDVVVVEGNHEDKHKRFRVNRVARPEVAEGMVESQPELATITDAMSAEDIAFMDGFVPFHRIPEHGIMVVHGGIPASMDAFPESVEEARALGGKRKKAFQCIMRTRHVHHETGKMVPMGAESEADPFWADVYDGRFGHVVFGHEPFMDGPQVREHSTGIDTGCVFGGRLTALVIESDGSRSFVSVPGRPVADRHHCC